MTDRKIKTPAQVKSEFHARGETFKAWSKKHGYHPVRVSGVLNGSIKGQRGKAHAIAVALGLK